MKRGEIWTVAGGKDYADKPRPAVIVQDDRFDMTDSLTVCGFTTDPSDAPLTRLPIQPSVGNGLRSVSRIMVDRITTVRRTKIGSRVGRLADEDIVGHEPMRLHPDDPCWYERAPVVSRLVTWYARRRGERLAGEAGTVRGA